MSRQGKYNGRTAGDWFHLWKEDTAALQERAEKAENLLQHIYNRVADVSSDQYNGATPWVFNACRSFFGDIAFLYPPSQEAAQVGEDEIIRVCMVPEHKSLQERIEELEKAWQRWNQHCMNRHACDWGYTEHPAHLRLTEEADSE